MPLVYSCCRMPGGGLLAPGFREVRVVSHPVGRWRGSGCDSGACDRSSSGDGRLGLNPMRRQAEELRGSTDAAWPLCAPTMARTLSVIRDGGCWPRFLRQADKAGKLISFSGCWPSALHVALQAGKLARSGQGARHTRKRGRIFYELSIQVGRSVRPPYRTALSKRTLCAVDPSASLAEAIRLSGPVLQCNFTPRRHELFDKLLAHRGRESQVG